MQACDYELGARWECGISTVQNEASRPMPMTILHQQGIHPHPGPDGNTITSIRDDPCWEAWGWNTWAEADPRELCATRVPSGGSPGETGNEIIVHDLTCNDEDGPTRQDQDVNDSFSDWYGYQSSVDHLCRGRRENVLGAEWIDEAAYARPPLTRMQAALSGPARHSSQDPSMNKLLRWQLGQGTTDSVPATVVQVP